VTSKTHGLNLKSLCEYRSIGGEGGHLEARGIDERIILKWVVKKWDGEAWSRLIWLRMGISGWLI